MAKWTNKINIPFAENGDKLPVPDTSEDGLVNNTAGFTSKYSQDPLIGGEYIRRETMNAIINDTQKAVKEIQEKAITKINNETPDTEGNIIVSYEGLRDKPDLGDLAYLDQVPYQSIGATELQANAVDTRNLKDSSVTRQKIAAGAINASKIETYSVTAKQLSTTAVVDNMKERFTQGPITSSLSDIEIPYITNGQGYRATGAALSAKILENARHPEIFNFYTTTCRYTNPDYSFTITNLDHYSSILAASLWPFTKTSGTVAPLGFLLGIQERYTEITGTLLETSATEYIMTTFPSTINSFNPNNNLTYRTKRYSELPERLGLLSFTLNINPGFTLYISQTATDAVSGGSHYLYLIFNILYNTNTPLYKAAFSSSENPVLLSKGIDVYAGLSIIHQLQDIYIPFMQGVTSGVMFDSVASQTNIRNAIVTNGVAIGCKQHTSQYNRAVNDFIYIYSGAVLTKNDTVNLSDGDALINPATFNVTLARIPNSAPNNIHLSFGPLADNTIHFLVDHDKFMRNYEALA